MTAPRMTAAKTFDRQPAAAHYSKPLDRLDRIRRASRNEPTGGRKMRRNTFLVKAYETNQYTFHDGSSPAFVSCSRITSRSSVLVLRGVVARATNTKSTWRVICPAKERYASRMMRRERLRCTAPPTLQTYREKTIRKNAITFPVLYVKTRTTDLFHFQLTTKKLQSSLKLCIPI